MPDRITEAIERRRRAESALTAANRGFDAAVREAVAAGESAISVARRAGVTRQRVYQILHDNPERKDER